jgi:hypothetical protein
VHCTPFVRLHSALLYAVEVHVLKGTSPTRSSSGNRMTRIARSSLTSTSPSLLTVRPSTSFRPERTKNSTQYSVWAVFWITFQLAWLIGFVLIGIASFKLTPEQMAVEAGMCLRNAPGDTNRYLAFTFFYYQRASSRHSTAQTALRPISPHALPASCNLFYCNLGFACCLYIGIDVLSFLVSFATVLIFGTDICYVMLL